MASTVSSMAPMLCLIQSKVKEVFEILEEADVAELDQRIRGILKK
jgi:hypothetical protein